MKLKDYVILSFILMGLAACAKDDTSLNSSKGNINVSIQAKSSLLQEEDSRSVDEQTPEVGNFKLSIVSEDGKVSSSWDKFSDFTPISVALGTYQITAGYGDANAEGFDALSYLGTTTVQVQKDETAQASVVCSINKAKIILSYSDAFKSYFSSYSAYVSSSKGNKIVYAADESRGAYFVPGELGVYLEVTRQGVSQKVTLNPKNFTAEIKHEYRLTMDVDASTASLKIVFNDNPASEQNVDINISDEALSAAAPAFTAYGFTSGQSVEVLEGETVSDRLDAYLNAPAGLSKCELVTSSPALKAQGWPESVDLMNLTGEQSQKLSALGLVTKGLGENHDKIAQIDFKQVLPYLYCTAEGNEVHTFTLRATDVLTKVSADMVLSVTTRNNGFAITLPESVPYGSTTMTADLTVEGDATKVKYYYWSQESWQQFGEDAVSLQSGASSGHYSVTLTYPFPLVSTDTNLKLKAECGRKTVEKEVKVEDPELTLSLKNGDADVWATKAYLQVTASAKSRVLRTISSSTVEIQYKVGEEWKAWPYQSYDSETGLFLLTGMGEGASDTQGVSYTLRAVYKRGGVASSFSQELGITTEPKAQVGNAGFEEWHTEVFNYTITWAGKGSCDWYLPWNTDENDVWWAVNSKKTMLSECTNWNLSFKVFPTVSWSSSISAEEGKAIQIATVATGAWATSGGGGSVSPHPGEIWIGTADTDGNHASEGHSFGSRPSSLSFWYQYESVKSETFYMKVELKAKDGTLLASNEISDGGEEIEGKVMTLPIDYLSTDKKVSFIYLVFKSSTKDSPEFNRNVSMDISDKIQTSNIGSVLRIDNIKLNYE